MIKRSEIRPLGSWWFPKGTEELKAFFESKLAERDLKIDEMTNTVNEMKIHGQVRTNLTKQSKSPKPCLFPFSEKGDLFGTDKWR